MLTYMQDLLQFSQNGSGDAPLWMLFLAIAMGASVILGRLPRN